MTLTQYVAEYGHSKYDWYFPFYDKTIAEIWPGVRRLMEIGNSEDSVKMWAACFRDSEIVGLDLNNGGPTNTDDLQSLATGRIKIVQGDQLDVDLLRSLGQFDVVIDDGSHKPLDQEISFRELFPAMYSGGWYFIEDVHTSYYKEYTQGKATVIDFMRVLIDDMHARYHLNMSQYWPVAEIRMIDSLVGFKRA